MSTEMIRIGCRIPNGIKLEVGYTATFMNPLNNRPVARYERQANYKALHIAGTRLHTREMRRQGIAVPAMPNPKPAFTEVPKDFWDAWKAAHVGSTLISSGMLFEAKGDKNNAQAAAVDAMAKSPGVFEPMDPKKTVKVGDAEVTMADFHEDNVQRGLARADS
jgi:hypothetical protein